MSQEKGEKTRKRFCEEWIADTIARADDNTHVTPAMIWIKKVLGIGI